MTSAGTFPIRLVLYGIAAIYLLADLVVSKGPLRHQLDNQSALLVGKKDSVIARVAGHPIAASQLDRAVSEHLWRAGKSPARVSPSELKAARNAAFNDLLDHELLRLLVIPSGPYIAVSDDEINDRLNRLTTRFESNSSMKTAMQSQGIATTQDLRDRLAVQLREEKFIALRLGASIKINDEEAKKWFNEYQLTLQQPERVEARHIFIPTLDHPCDEAKKKLDTAFVTLTDKKQDFATLAKELSEDPATKDSGGALGWMTRDRLPADFSAPLFSLEPNQPRLIRTKIGWHLAAVTARKPSEPRSFEQAKAEIVAALVTLKSQQAVADFRKSLRLHESAKIEISHDTLVQ